MSGLAVRASGAWHSATSPTPSAPSSGPTTSGSTTSSPPSATSSNPPTSSSGPISIRRSGVLSPTPTAAQLGGFGWRLADTRLASAAVPVGYFAEYPEDINIFGLSAATELFGIAWGAEVSYQTRHPVPINGELALRNLILEVTETGQRTKRSGFIREESWQAQLNAIATIGPGDPYVGAIVRALRISSIAATVEVAVVKFPSLDNDIAYQPTNGGGQVDEFSWGYTTLIQGFYDNPFGVPITRGTEDQLQPRRERQHARLLPLHRGTERRFRLASTWITWESGSSTCPTRTRSERAPPTMLPRTIDRDFVSFSVTRSF